MSHVPYSTDSVNSQPTPVPTVQNHSRPVVSVNNTTPPIHTVNSHPQQPTPVYITAPTNKQAVHISPLPDINPPPATKLTARQLFNTLQPLLTHQHSTLTTIHALLTLHLHRQGPPTPKTMKTLNTLLQDCPTARHLLPAAPSRPIRHRTVLRTRPPPPTNTTPQRHIPPRRG